MTSNIIVRQNISWISFGSSIIWYLTWHIFVEQCTYLAKTNIESLKRVLTSFLDNVFSKNSFVVIIIQKWKRKVNNLESYLEDLLNKQNCWKIRC
jgi:hypothetical protein